MISLPTPRSRATVRGFWLVSSLAVGIGTGLVMAVAEASAPAWTAALVAAAVAAPGMLWPHLVSLPYRAWNRLARYYADAASAYVTAVCFATVVLAAGRAARSPHFSSPPRDSTWVTRGTQPAGSYGSQDHGPLSARGGWMATLARWAPTSGNGWTLLLLPFLLLLRVLDKDPDQAGQAAVPSDIYTLY